jgi:hypothetical protein
MSGPAEHPGFAVTQAQRGDTAARSFERRILGAPLLRAWQTVIASAAAGSIIAMDSSQSSRMGDPFLVFLVPAWILFISGQVHGFLRKPRDADFAFVIGVPYAERLLIAGRYVRAMMIQNALSAVSCMAPFLLVRVVRCGIAEIHESGAIACAVFVELGISFGVMRLLYDRYLSRPNRHDRIHVPVLSAPGRNDGSILREIIARSILRISYAGAGFAKRPLQPFIRRQILYLIRKDRYSSVALQACGVVIAAVLTAALSVAAPKIVLAANLFIPLAILFANGAAFIESAERLGTCGYYSLSFRDFVRVNVRVCGIMIVPYVMASLACICAYRRFDIVDPVTLIQLSSLVLCFAGLVGCFALRFCQASGDGMGNVIMVIAIFCSFMGMLSAVAGSALPALGLPAIPLVLLWARLYFAATTALA